jgi:carboxyl-terminal processing protease
MSQRNLVIFSLTLVICCVCYARGEHNPFARYLASALDTIENRSLEPITGRDLFNGAMEGMVEVLHTHGDMHSAFYDERETGLVLEELHQKIGGIGVRIRILGEPPRLVIVGPPEPGSPAARADIRAGDHILAINGHPTDGMSMEDVLGHMRGRAGERVSLEIERGSEPMPRTLDLVRAVIDVESVLGDVRGPDGRWRFALQSDPRIAHVRVTSFGDRTAAELQATLEQLTAEGVAAVALDLRDNPGGALDATIAVCNLFMPPGKLIVETRGRRGQFRHRDLTGGSGPHFALPLAVLVNGNSASASEIVAACLQDHGRAVVVGQQTYGKGTVQQLLPTQAGKSMLKLTWASFWRPSGDNIHRPADVDATDDGVWGVLPREGFDIRLTEEEYGDYLRYRAHRDMLGLMPPGTDFDRPPANFIDRQLNRAVQHLQAVLTEGDQRDNSTITE